MKKYHLIIISIVIIGLVGTIGSFLSYNDYYQATKGIKKNPKLKEDINFTLSSYSKYENCDQIFTFVIIPSSTKGIVKGKYRHDHNEPYIYIETDKYFFKLSARVNMQFNDDGMYDYVLENDSIFKNKGSAIYTIKRGNIIKNFKVGKESEYWINPYYESYSDTLHHKKNSTI